MEEFLPIELEKKLLDFGGSFLVVCPVCSGCANVTCSQPGSSGPKHYLLECSHCMHFEQVNMNFRRGVFDTGRPALKILSRT